MLARWKKNRGEVLSLLGHWLDLSPEELEIAADLAESGGYERRLTGSRVLHIPEGPLYTAQSRVVEVFLKTAPVAAAAHGGVPGRSVVTHAATHLPGARALFIADLTNAYGSVKASSVAATLRRLLKRPCHDLCIGPELRRELADFLTLICTVADQLPQGAPTSAGLFNLALGPLDKGLEKLVSSLIGRDGRYSRYLDDLVISSPSGLPGELGEKVGHAVIVHDLGKLNRSKTRLLDRARGDELVITGISHDGSGFVLGQAELAEQVKNLRMLRSMGRPDKQRRRARGIVNYLTQIYGARRLPSQVKELAGPFLKKEAR